MPRKTMIARILALTGVLATAPTLARATQQTTCGWRSNASYVQYYCTDGTTECAHFWYSNGSQSDRCYAVVGA